MGSPTIYSERHHSFPRRQTSQPDAATSTSSPRPTSSPVAKSNSVPPVGVIAGIVIGAIVLSLIMASIFACFRRKKLRKQDEEARAARAKKQAESRAATPKTPRTPRSKISERIGGAPDGYHLKNRQSTGLLDDFFAMDVPDEKTLPSDKGSVSHSEGSMKGEMAVVGEASKSSPTTSTEPTEIPDVPAVPSVPEVSEIKTQTAPTTSEEKPQTTATIVSEPVTEAPKEQAIETPKEQVVEVPKPPHTEVAAK